MILSIFASTGLAMRKSKKNIKRKNRFKTFSFKLSLRQYKSLQNYSIIKGTTPIKVIKNRIHEYIEEYTDEKIGKEVIIKNQLNLFKPLPPVEEQLELFD